MEKNSIMMTYPETIDYLYHTAPMFQQVGGSAYKEGLETTIELNKRLGNPYQAFQSVHVAGTNGKGSVSQMLYAVLREAGYRVGLYTSPHLKDFRERIQVNGIPMPEAAVVEFVERMRPDIETLHPSFFEITTVMAFDWFRHEGVDIAVVEVGMGGRLDCTNVITPLVSVITNISFDHMQFLGDTLPKIAAEKAGIIKPAVPVVVGEYQPETAPTFIARAHETDSPIFFADQRYRCAQHEGRLYEVENLLDGYRFTLQLGMEGDYQQRNLCTALAALDCLTERLPRPLTTMEVRRGRAPARGPRAGGDNFPPPPPPPRRPLPDYLRYGPQRGRTALCDCPIGTTTIPHPLLYPRSGGGQGPGPYPAALAARGALSLYSGSASAGFVRGSAGRARPRRRTAWRGGVLHSRGGGGGAHDLIFVGGSTFTVAEVL